MLTMIAGVLPDREQRHRLQFHVWPRLGYRTRLAVAGALILAGVAVQLSWPTMNWQAMLIFSIPLILAGNALLLVCGFDLRPSHESKTGEWEKTTLDRLRAARRLEDDANSWDQTLIDISCVPGFLILAFLAGLAVVVFVALNDAFATRMYAPVFVADAAALALPHWLTGLRQAWRPVSLAQQIDALQEALGVVGKFRNPPCQIQPMFEMTGTGEKRVPVGARVLVRFPDGPKDFLGLQIQVAINNVQGTKYPYLYGVLLARKEFGIIERSKPVVDDECSGLTVEPKSEPDVDVIVIRQTTTLKSGYHTGPASIRQIAGCAWRVASKLAQ